MATVDKESAFSAGYITSVSLFGSRSYALDAPLCCVRSGTTVVYSEQTYSPQVGLNLRVLLHSSALLWRHGLLELYCARSALPILPVALQLSSVLV